MTTPSHTAGPGVATPRRTYMIGRARPNAIVGKNRETGEIGLIIVGAFLGMMSGLLIPVLSLRIPALVGFPVLALAMIYVPYKGRTFYKWFEINRSYKRMLRQGTAYRSEAAEAGVRLDGREVEIGPPPGVGRINWLAAPFGPDEIAVLLHADRRTVTAAIEIEGPGVGLRDSEDQEALVDRFGTLLKHVANGDGYVTRLQMLARTLPADPDAHAKDVAQRGDERAADWLRTSYDQLQSMVSTSSEQHRAYLVACMHYGRELATEGTTIAKAARRTMRPQAEQGRGHGHSDGPRTHRHLRPPGRGRHPGPPAAGPGEALLADPLDVRPGPPHRPHPGHDQAQRLARRAGRDGADLPPGQDPGVHHPRPWCHATAWVKEWPMTPVGVNFLAPLLVHTPDVIRTVAVAMDLEPTELAIERMLTEKTNDEAEASRAAKMNRTVDPRDIAAHGRVDQRGEDLASGAAGVNLVGYITVSSRSPSRWPATSAPSGPRRARAI